MKIKIALIAAVALLGQDSAFSAACSLGICSGQISLLYADANGDAYVGLVGGLGGLTGCVPNQGEEQFLTLSAGSSNMKLIYATLLAAQMSGRSVTIVLQVNSSGCTIRYVTLP